MFVEDIDAFFADFNQSASWTPSLGGPVQIVGVILDQPDENIFGGGELSHEWAITYSSTKFSGLKTGEIIVINSINYKVREIKSLDDGSLITAKLSKI